MNSVHPSPPPFLTTCEWYIRDKCVMFHELLPQDGESTPFEYFDRFLAKPVRITNRNRLLVESYALPDSLSSRMISRGCNRRWNIVSICITRNQDHNDNDDKYEVVLNTSVNVPIFFHADIVQLHQLLEFCQRTQPELRLF
jgi:hypothetical protein